MSILIGRTLKRYMPFFITFGQGVERHILHQYSEEMSRKSSVVSCAFGVLFIHTFDIHFFLFRFPSVITLRSCNLYKTFLGTVVLYKGYSRSHPQEEGMVDVMEELQQYVPVVISEHSSSMCQW